VSRYTITTKEPYEVVVGWDRPLNTYFAQVYDKSIVDEDQQLIIWEMGTPDPVHDLNQIQDIVKPYLADEHNGRIPQNVLRDLIADSEK
jgi:hypothetical protein